MNERPKTCSECRYFEFENGCCLEPAFVFRSKDDVACRHGVVLVEKIPGFNPEAELAKLQKRGACEAET